MGELAGVKPTGAHWSVYAVNDGSSQLPETIAIPEGLSLNILHLSMNLGHQRAINIGLCYLLESQPNWEQVLIMDSDGEDRPQDIASLMEKYNGKTLVFAERRKRSEGWAFKAFYAAYRTAFKVLTGKFSALPIAACPGNPKLISKTG